MNNLKERFAHLFTTIPGAIIMLGAFVFVFFLIHKGHASLGEIIALVAALTGGAGLVAYKGKNANKPQ